MAKIFVVSMLVALSRAHVVPVAHPGFAHAGLAHAGLAHHAVGHAVVGHTVQEHIHAGPPVARTHHAVVGHRQVQVGTQGVQTGVAYTQEKSVSQAAPFTYVAAPPKTTQTTVPVAPPVIPAAPAPYAAIPPAPTNQGPAPADTVTITKIAAPVRTHTVITPQVKRIEPELQVNKYNVDVPRAVPVPVEREVIVEKHVAKPYPVEVPQPYAVPQPYKVHPVHHVVETPVVDQHHVTVHQPAVAHVAHVAAPAFNTLAHPAPLAHVAHAGLAHHGFAHAGLAHAGLAHPALFPAAATVVAKAE